MVLCICFSKFDSDRLRYEALIKKLRSKDVATHAGVVTLNLEEWIKRSTGREDTSSPSPFNLNLCEMDINSLI